MTSQFLKPLPVVYWDKVQVEDKILGYVVSVCSYDMGTMIIAGTVDWTAFLKLY